MKPVEAQLWVLALDQERQRVEKVQEEAKGQGKKTSVTFDPRNVAKPWSWESRSRISLHDISASLVLGVDGFDFDLENEGFQAFLKPIGLLHLGGAPRSKYWLRMNDPAMNEKDFKAIEDFWYAQEFLGQRHRYSDGEMETHWRIFQFGRVTLQAAWDVYSTRERPIATSELQ